MQNKEVVIKGETLTAHGDDRRTKSVSDVVDADMSKQFLNSTSAQYSLANAMLLKLHRNEVFTIGLKTIAVVKSI